MSPTDYSAIIEKIKKLFALSKSPNENEASLALQRAKEMMCKYNIEQQDLAKDQVEDIVEIDMSIANKFNLHQTTLAVKVSGAFNVKPILIKTKTGYHKAESKIRFIGATADLAVATYVFSYLLNISEIKGQEFFESIRYRQSKWSPSTAKKMKADYSYGFVNGVSKNLEALQKQREVENPYEVEVEKALVLVKSAHIEDYIKETQGKLSTHKGKKTYNREAYEAGRSVGEKQGIYNGVTGRTTNQLSIGA